MKNLFYNVSIVGREGIFFGIFSTPRRVLMKSFMSEKKQNERKIDEKLQAIFGWKMFLKFFCSSSAWKDNRNSSVKENHILLWKWIKILLILFWLLRLKLFSHPLPAESLFTPRIFHGVSSRTPCRYSAHNINCYLVKSWRRKAIKLKDNNKKLK